MRGKGYPQIAKLFRAAAEAETVHAHNHLREMQGIKNTKDNVESAINGESHEFQVMYPKMMADAKAEGNQGAWKSFYYANEVERIHANLFKKAHKYFGDADQFAYHVCQVCGNTVEGDAPDVCSVCGAKRDMLRKVV